MTLNTKVFVLDPVDVQALFREGQRLLYLADQMSGEATGLTVETMHMYDRPEQGIVRGAVWNEDHTEVIEPCEWGSLGTGVREIGNDLGQGLPAIWDIDYREDGEVLYRREDHTEYCNISANKYYDADEGDCDGTDHQPTHYAVGSFDTAYGYRSPLGGCSDLHASLIIALHTWLTERGVRMAWRNEYTSEIFEGIEGLDTLAESGAKAMDWFRGTVMPAVEAHAAREGGKVDWS